MNLRYRFPLLLLFLYVSYHTLAVLQRLKAKSHDFSRVDEADMICDNRRETPDESVMGVDLNPIARYDDEELIEEFNDDIVDGRVNDVEQSGEHSAVLLGDDVTVREYVVVVETGDGDEFEADVFVTETVNDDDIVLAAGAQPTGFGEDEQFTALIESIEHPAEQ